MKRQQPIQRLIHELWASAVALDRARDELEPVDQVADLDEEFARLRAAIEAIADDDRL